MCIFFSYLATLVLPVQPLKPTSWGSFFDRLKSVVDSLFSLALFLLVILPITTLFEFPTEVLSVGLHVWLFLMSD